MLISSRRTGKRVLLINSREMSKDVGTRTKRLSNKRILTDIKSMERDDAGVVSDCDHIANGKGFFL